MKITVMTFNMHHGKGTDGKLDLSRISEIIRESKVDIVGLNEVDHHFSKRSNHVDQLKWLSEDLNMAKVFGVATTLRARRDNLKRQYGNGLLTHYPIDSLNNHILQAQNWWVEGRALLEVKIKLNTKWIKI